MYEHKNYFENHPVCRKSEIDWACREEKHYDSAYEWLFGADEDYGMVDGDHATVDVANNAANMKPFVNNDFGPDFEWDTRDQGGEFGK